MRSRWIVAGSLALVLGACTAGRGSETASSASGNPDDVVLLRTATGALALETGTGLVITQDPGALVAPDGSRLYTTAADGRRTTVTTIDPNTGATLAMTSVDGVLEARAASLSGDAIAMMAPRPPGVEEWTPIPRAHSTIVVADPTGAQSLRRYHLAGNFEPEAFSVDDRSLFMIQYLPAEAPAAYRVTTLDLSNSVVRPVFGRFKTPPERMPGIRLRQTFDATTKQLYTLYTNEPSTYLRASSEYGRGTSAYGGGWANGSHANDEVTFVHVLNLREGWAYCAGMPHSLWGQPAKAQAMAASPDGRILYIVDSMRGIVTEMNTRSLEIVRTRHVDLGNGTGRETAVVASPDGSTLYVASAADGAAVYTVDTGTLKATGRWALQGQVSDLRLSNDGARLYAALGDQLGVLDVANGSLLTTFAADGVESILNVETSAP
jgi:DNA-binding beta-propeller fold protein YncE